ncbi:MAG: thiol-disulfide oxidoreductase ResA [Kurthia sp.]|uniref:Peroxiredoxin n=1 Tax=Kurthia zopfii TaxID=1650 RepID=A0A2U3AFW8_9BACL|nr:thiol-disulfide oxidoreductase ResA [Kurthia zopfii]PWI23439.1 thiol-disulfide oxidoreductase [Kurthia zopfii]TDR39825.1 peroxiredoxin [Kurthia zopfii]STX09274.1 Thiol-disulfide oxidoreductase resA [Kurthia zopfii]VEI06209.1 Thiol-disulfide oxidoreductase resA [Kurthia zopfii]GEK30713.1 thiol-disulfide oxidoreductase ResA [Kurthia zopfii]
MVQKKKRLVIRSIILAILVAAIAYTVYVTATKDPNKVIKAGDSAPNFVLTDLDGKKHQLSDYKGQGVLLNFWGTWCPPCKEEMPALNNAYAKYKDQNVQVISINIAQSNFEVQNFVDEYKLNFPMTIDRSKSVMRAYNVDQLPATFLINKEGKITEIITHGITETQFEQYMESIKPQ